MKPPQKIFGAMRELPERSRRMLAYGTFIFALGILVFLWVIIFPAELAQPHETFEETQKKNDGTRGFVSPARSILESMKSIDTGVDDESLNTNMYGAKAQGVTDTIKNVIQKLFGVEMNK